MKFKDFVWDPSKNQKLFEERGVSFETITSHITRNGLLGTMVGKGKCAHQEQFVVNVNDYVYLVPFVENENQYFLKTIFPSRKMTRILLRGENK
jgi:uncharacterized DUF497 family protein